MMWRTALCKTVPSIHGCLHQEKELDIRVPYRQNLKKKKKKRLFCFNLGENITKKEQMQGCKKTTRNRERRITNLSRFSPR